MEKILRGGRSGIGRRHIAIEDPRELFGFDPGGLNRYFERVAPQLAERSLVVACARGGVAPCDLAGLVVCTCTGYLCPGLTSHVAERTGVRSDAVLVDLVGAGCGAAIPALRVADGLAGREPGGLVAVVAVEVCSAAFFLADDPGVLVSLCLFGDAAHASVWTGSGDGGVAGTGWRLGGFRTAHRPLHRESIRFANDAGFLRNCLDRGVPELAAGAVAEMVPTDGVRVVSHAGGRDVLDAVVSMLPGQAMVSSREELWAHGNCSSPSVLMALERDLSVGGDGDRWITSFGAGFACHGARLTRADATS